MCVCMCIYLTSKFGLRKATLLSFEKKFPNRFNLIDVLFLNGKPNHKAKEILSDNQLLF